MRIEYDIQCQGEVLERFYLDRTAHSMIMGPLGSAKTTTSCLKLFDLMCEQPPNPEGIRPTRFVAIRNTSGDLSSTTIKDWLEAYSELGTFKGPGASPAQHNLHFELDDGTIVKSELIFLPLDREDAVRKLRGFQVTGFWLNETKELNKAVVDMADGRHGRYPTMIQGGVDCGWHGMLGDYNAPDEDEWIYKYAEETKPKGWIFFKQPGGVTKSADGKTWELNPNAENILNLPPNYYENLLQGKNDDWISVNIANEYGFSLDGKPVHPGYKDSMHCQPCDPIEGYSIDIGMDFGLTPAATFGQKVNGQWRVFDELCTEDMAADQFGSLVLDKLNGEYRGFEYNTPRGDPSGASGNQSTKDNVFKVLRAQGLHCLPAGQNNDPLIRRKALSQHFIRLTITSEPGIIIDPRCKTLRKGLAGKFSYRRLKVSGDERYENKPNKNFWSHICEACEYMMVGAGEDRTVLNGSRPRQRVVTIPTKINVFG